MNGRLNTEIRLGLSVTQNLTRQDVFGSLVFLFCSTSCTASGVVTNYNKTNTGGVSDVLR